jgi:hypothetical protein
MYWRALAYLGGLAAFAAVVWFYGNARYDAGVANTRAEANRQVALANANALDNYVKGIQDEATRSAAFIDWQARTFQPARDTVTREIVRYQASPVGAVVCFDNDSVRAANGDVTAANALAATAPGNAGTLPAATPDND